MSEGIESVIVEIDCKIPVIFSLSLVVTVILEPKAFAKTYINLSFICFAAASYSEGDNLSGGRELLILPLPLGVDVAWWEAAGLYWKDWTFAKLLACIVNEVVEREGLVAACDCCWGWGMYSFAYISKHLLFFNYRHDNIIFLHHFFFLPRFIMHDIWYCCIMTISTVAVTTNRSARPREMRVAPFCW